MEGRDGLADDVPEDVDGREVVAFVVERTVDVLVVVDVAFVVVLVPAFSCALARFTCSGVKIVDFIFVMTVLNCSN